MRTLLVILKRMSLLAVVLVSGGGGRMSPPAVMDAKKRWRRFSGYDNGGERCGEEKFCNAPLRKEDRYVIIMAFHQSIFKKA
uniref:Secreted protein n=1 Tax=Tanacetum cinerariifolium TaxID=118510 RepID=A0A699SQM2_TANCI|nr:hypothetical protein [Tanacetum cinerariifolium]